MIPQVVFRVVTWIITVIIGAVPALCPRCAKTPPYTAVTTTVLAARSSKRTAVRLRPAGGSIPTQRPMESRRPDREKPQVRDPSGMSPVHLLRYRWLVEADQRHVAEDEVLQKVAAEINTALKAEKALQFEMAGLTQAARAADAARLGLDLSSATPTSSSAAAVPNVDDDDDDDDDDEDDVCLFARRWSGGCWATVKMHRREGPHTPIPMHQVRCRGTALQCSAAVPCCANLCCVLCCACAVLCCAVLYYAVLCCAVLCCGVVWCGVVWCGVVWCGVLCCTMLCCAVLCCAVLCCGVVWCGVLCCAALRCAVQHSTRHSTTHHTAQHSTAQRSTVHAAQHSKVFASCARSACLACTTSPSCWGGLRAHQKASR